MAQFELRASKYPKNRCCYLCSILHKERDILTIEVGFINGIAAGWLIWKSASRVLCNCRIPIRLESIFYRTTNRISHAFMGMWGNEK